MSKVSLANRSEAQALPTPAGPRLLEGSSTVGPAGEMMVWRVHLWYMADTHELSKKWREELDAGTSPLNQWAKPGAPSPQAASDVVDESVRCLARGEGRGSRTL
jgi:hypothetical protein